MNDDLFAPLDRIMRSADAIMSDETVGELNPFQWKFVNAIQTASREIGELLISASSLSGDKAQEVLSFELRSHLSSVIGYAESLLEETDGELTPVQRQQVLDIGTNGRELLNRVLRLWE